MSTDTPRLTVDLVRRVLGILDPKDRRLLFVYVLGSFAVALTEVVGLATILPLVQLITERRSATATWAPPSTPGSRNAQPSPPLPLGRDRGCLRAQALLGLGMQWWGSGFTMRLQVRLQEKLLTAFLTEEYSAHRRRNTAEVVRATGQAAGDALGKVLGGVMGSPSPRPFQSL